MTTIHKFFPAMALIAFMGCTPVEDNSSPECPTNDCSEPEKETCPGGLCIVTDDYLNRVPSQIPDHYRYHNYIRNREGSCVHASLATIMMYLDHAELANAWTDAFGGGELPNGLHKKLDESGIVYDSTTSGEELFLDSCMEVNQPCIVSFKTAHMCLLVGLDPNYLWTGDQWIINPRPKAYVIDPNNPHKVESFSRSAFIGNWRSNGGWATTIFF